MRRLVIAALWGSTAGCLSLLACEPRRDPDYPQYTQPRWETLAWRRATGTPSPELSITPPKRRRKPSLDGRTDATRPPSASARGLVNAGADGGAPHGCHRVAMPDGCTDSVAFGCGVYEPDGRASSDPPVEMLLLASSVDEVGRLAANARAKGAVSLPARSCTLTEADVCRMTVSVRCTDASGHTTVRAKIPL